MPGQRRYAGPLQRGKKSAKVPAKRPRKRLRLVKSLGLNSVEKKQVKNIITARKEPKYCPAWINYDHYDPALYNDFQQAPIQPSTILPNVYNVANGVCSIVGFQTGKYLNSSAAQLDANLVAAGQNPCMYPLGGFSMQRGDSSTQIDGNEVFFNNGKINLQITTVVNVASSVDPMVNPLCYRILHVKARKDAAGVTPSISGQLFRDMTNDNAGFMSDMTQRQLFHDYSINRQRFTVLADKRFKLIQNLAPSLGTNVNQPCPNYPYPSQKNITLYLDKPKKKLRISESDNGQNNSFEPTNYDYVHYVFVMCCREQVNSGSFSQTGKAWTITTQGQSSFIEA